jgi:hypothetical protein
MRTDTHKVLGKEKNQLIARHILEEGHHSVTWLARLLGGGFLIGGVAWAVKLWSVLSSHIDSSNLQHWGLFGDAVGAPIGLATLGTLILSFEYVNRQLRAHQQTEKTQYQPVVTCMALLDYSVEGTNKEEKIKITEPVLKLRVRNFGHSPATFIDIEIEDFYIMRAGGVTVPLYDKLNSSSMHIDHLWEHASGTNGMQHKVELSLSDELPEEVATLIDKILDPKGDSYKDKLELTLRITHENVMGLEYMRGGTFSWSRTLCERDKSEREQVEYIESFQKARTNGSPKERTIGQFIKRSQPLQAALKSELEQLEWYLG